MTSALREIESLFDTRGGLDMAHTCEICREPLDHDAVSAICDECFTESQQEDGE